VRDTDHLVVARQLPQLLTHDLSASSADTGINLVEDQGRRCIGSRENGLQREH